MADQNTKQSAQYVKGTREGKIVQPTDLTGLEHLITQVNASDIETVAVRGGGERVNMLETNPIVMANVDKIKRACKNIGLEFIPMSSLGKPAAKNWHKIVKAGAGPQSTPRLSITKNGHMQLIGFALPAAVTKFEPVRKVKDKATGEMVLPNGFVTGEIKLTGSDEDTLRAIAICLKHLATSKSEEPVAKVEAKVEAKDEAPAEQAG